MYWTVKPKAYAGSVLKSLLELLFVQLYYYGKNEEEECPPGMHVHHESRIQFKQS